MQHIRTLATLAIVIGLAGRTLSAQSVKILDENGPRVTAQIGYGGKGVDVAAAIDSPRFLDLVRFRADVGHGAWEGINSRGGEPQVTRATGSALLFFRPPGDPSAWGYLGVGIGAYVPHGAGMHAQFGPRLTLGFEGDGYPWTIGFELQFDGPAGDPFNSLLPTGRFALGIRRSF